MLSLDTEDDCTQWVDTIYSYSDGCHIAYEESLSSGNSSTLIFLKKKKDSLKIAEKLKGFSTDLFHLATRSHSNGNVSQPSTPRPGATQTQPPVTPRFEKPVGIITF